MVLSNRIMLLECSYKAAVLSACVWEVIKSACHWWANPLYDVPGGISMSQSNCWSASQLVCRDSGATPCHYKNKIFLAGLGPWITDLKLSNKSLFGLHPYSLCWIKGQCHLDTLSAPSGKFSNRQLSSVGKIYWRMRHKDCVLFVQMTPMSSYINQRRS